MQNSVFFSFLVYTESEYTITTNLHIVKKFLGLFAKKNRWKLAKIRDV